MWAGSYSDADSSDDTFSNNSIVKDTLAETSIQSQDKKFAAVVNEDEDFEGQIGSPPLRMNNNKVKLSQELNGIERPQTNDILESYNKIDSINAEMLADKEDDEVSD